MQKLRRIEIGENPTGPLTGLKVLDLSRLIAGNMLSLQLADFGADVLKVEPPEGDSLRNFKTEGLDVWWKTYARNKKSICLNLREKASIQILLKLAKKSDVFIESFRPGVLEAMGLGPEILLALNPKMVIVRISGWGQDGLYKNKPGFGTLVEGYTGFAAINGFEDRPPVLPPIFLGDMTAGLYGASATMMALWSTRVQGATGQVVDLSLFDPMLSILGPQVANYHFTQKLKKRTGSQSNTTAPRNAYLTQDGKWLCLSTASPAIVDRLFKLVGREDMLTDPRFNTNAARLKHLDEVDAAIGGFIATQSLEDNLALFSSHEITAGPINDASMLLNDEYVISRNSVFMLEDDDLGELPMHHVVPRFEKTPGNIYRKAPKKGQHNQEILSPLLGEEIYQGYVQSGVVVS